MWLCTVKQFLHKKSLTQRSKTFGLSICQTSTRKECLKLPPRTKCCMRVLIDSFRSARSLPRIHLFVFIGFCVCPVMSSSRGTTQARARPDAVDGSSDGARVGTGAAKYASPKRLPLASTCPSEDPCPSPKASFLSWLLMKISTETRWVYKGPGRVKRILIVDCC